MVCQFPLHIHSIVYSLCLSLPFQFSWHSVRLLLFTVPYISLIRFSCYFFIRFLLLHFYLLQRNEKKHSRRGYNNLVDKSFILVGTEHEKHYSPTHNMKWIENVCSCDVWKFVSFVRIEDLCECSNSFKTMHSFNRLCNGMKNVIRYSFVYRLLASASDSFCLHFFFKRILFAIVNIMANDVWDVSIENRKVLREFSVKSLKRKAL